MSVSPQETLATAIAFTLYAVILYSGWRLDLIRHYRLFYGYILYMAVRDFSMWAALFAFGGHESQVYAWSFTAIAIISMLLGIALLTQFYARFKSGKDAAAWVGIAVFTLMMMWFFSNHGFSGLIFQIYVASTSTLLHFQLLFCLLVLAHLLIGRRVRVGISDYVIVAGLAVGAAVQYLGWTLVTTRLIPYGGEVQQWLPLLGPMPLIIWALGLRRRHVPSIELSQAEQRQIGLNRSLLSSLARERVRPAKAAEKGVHH